MPEDIWTTGPAEMTSAVDITKRTNTKGKQQLRDTMIIGKTVQCGALFTLINKLHASIT